MTHIQEQLRTATPDIIRSFTPDDLFQAITTIDDSPVLRRIALHRFESEASVQNDDPDAPFILWPAINRHPRQHWLPLLLGKVARAEHPHSSNGHPHLVVPIPSSASWYLPTLRDNSVFEGAMYPLVMKEKQREEYGNPNTSSARAVAVPSYVHERKPDGSRGTQNIYIFTPELYRDADVTLIDDALAEGETLLTLATFLKEELAVRSIHAVVPMAKAKQGGLAKVEEHPRLIDAMTVLITVTQTHGRGEHIEYTAGTS